MKAVCFVLSFLYLTFLACVMLAQDKPQAGKELPDGSILLLPFEIQRLRELNPPLEKAVNVLNLALETSKNLQNDDKVAAKVGYQVSAAVWQLSAAKSNWDSWFEGVRKSHKCLDCELDGERLVRRKPVTSPITEK